MEDGEMVWKGRELLHGRHTVTLCKYLRTKHARHKKQGTTNDNHVSGAIGTDLDLCIQLSQTWNLER